MARSFSVRDLSITGKLAALALVCNALLSAVTALEWLAYTIPAVSQSEAVQELVQTVDSLHRLVAPAAGVLFLFWWSYAIRDAHEAGVKTSFTRQAAVLAFFIPILNLFRPYRALRELHAASDAALLPEPAPEPLTTEHHNAYRDAAIVVRPSVTTPEAPLRLWWALYVLRLLLNTADRMSGSKETTLPYALAVNAIELTGAAVTPLVVLRVSGRIRMWQQTAEMTE